MTEDRLTRAAGLGGFGGLLDRKQTKFADLVQAAAADSVGAKLRSAPGTVRHAA